VPDLARFPELRWLQANRYVPAVVLAVGTLLFGGWTGLVVGFFWSTVLLYHGTFLINSLAHVHGTRRYVTGDDSRNTWWLALLTLGDGWHNNHHACTTSTRQGFRLWEVDVTYCVLKALSWLGLVWDLHEPPPSLRPHLEGGWLTFQAPDGERRRIVPIPAAWESLGAADLRRLLARAEVQPRTERRLLE
jgi:stearoyl-CoA desaturase (delta-9 desaturase)